MARPRLKPLPEIATLQARFAYSPISGELHLRHKVERTKRDRTWNLRYAGRKVGCRMNVGYLFVNMGHGLGMILGHRLAWALHYGVWPPAEVDHRDGDKLNNRIANLRLASRSANNYNRPGSAMCGFKGVRQNKRGGKFRASIMFNRTRYELGTFETPELAHAAYQQAARRHHGEFANMNITRRGFIAARVVFGMAA